MSVSIPGPLPCSTASFALIWTLGALSSPLHAAAAPAPRAEYEARGLWVTRWDYRSAEDVRSIIRNAAAHYFNIVLFQVRGEATVFYRSALEPWAWELTGKTPASCGQNPGWDPLATALAEARAAGVELHAYMNVLPGWNQKTNPPRSSGQVRVAHPEWFMFTPDRKPMPVANIYAFLNPAHPQVKAHLTAVFEEVARNYDVDGIHLDYIRFPGEFNGGKLTYDPVSLGLFKAQCGAAPEEKPEEWERFCANQVTDVVRRIHDAVKAIKPSLMLSAAVTGDYQKAVTENRQASLEWLNQGYVDCLIPMNYTSDLDQFGARGRVYLENRRRGLIYMGMMAKHGEPTLRAQISAARSMGAQGVSIFAYATLFPDHKPSKLARVLKEEIFRHPARIAGRLYSE